MLKKILLSILILILILALAAIGFLIYSGAWRLERDFPKLRS